MRSAMIIVILSLLVITTHAQDVKPKIVGQKELSTEEGQPITIQLTDLYVEETPVESDDDKDNGEGTGHDNDSGNNGDDDDSASNDDDDQEEGEGEHSDNEGSEEGEDGEGDDDDEGHDRDDDEDDRDEDGDDNEDEKKDKKDDKGDQGDKENKGKKGDKGNKGKGSNEGSTYPDGYTLIVLEWDNYSFTGTTVLPNPGFTGVLGVLVRVANAKYASSIFTVKITVIPSAVEPNRPPVITGQSPLSTATSTPLVVKLSDLQVTDPDDQYPEGFTLNLQSGDNYKVNGLTVTPADGFSGALNVPATVNDGEHNSEIFLIKITVTPGVNVKPVITGQAGLKIPQGESLEIKLTHFTVEDPDNRYPEDFTLIVSSGDNYAVSNRTVTPDQTFLGTLTVKVSVHDGKVASDPFDVKIQVISGDKLEIVGQKAISVPEDSSLIISVNDLIVNDPSNRYPEGFKINIRSGEHYEVKQNRIIPARDYSGNLTVPVIVAQGAVSSAPFQLLIVVEPVNDAPELVNIPSDPVLINRRGTWPLFPGVDVIDVDDEYMLFAEIGFRDGKFNAGRDKIGFNSVSNLHAVFDEATGVLYVVGRGSLTEYRDLIQSATYDFDGSPDSLLAAPGYIYVKLNDGKATSAEYERMLMFDSEVELDIPTAFTPNNDNANDTWAITPLQEGEQIHTFIRVYDKKGNLVFESSDFQQAWDGHYNGSPLPADVYFYTIEMDVSYRKISYKGIVSILR